MARKASSPGRQGKTQPATATNAATKLTANPTMSNFIATKAGALFDARRPSSRRSNGPRSRFDQIAIEIASRSADPKARLRAISGIGIHRERERQAPGIDRRRKGVRQVDRLNLSREGL